MRAVLLGTLVAAQLAACAPAPVPAPPANAPAAAPVRADFHALCPLAVGHPSLTPVFDMARWNAVLAAARTSPPPYAAGATDFTRETVIVVALPRTPTPTTNAHLAPGAAVFDAAAGRWTLGLVVERRTVGPGQVGVTVVGEPCLVAWLPARTGVREVVAREVSGGVIARWSRAP